MNVIFMGPPGAGKGTCAGNVTERFSLKHLSTGNVLRENIANNTELGKIAKPYVEGGKLLPDDLINQMVGEFLKTAAHGVLFDGYPRTVVQAEMLCNIAKIDVVINLDCNLDVVAKRITTRRTCKDCNAVYSSLTLGDATACAKCGGELYVRDDDKLETVTERFNTYMEKTRPLVEFFEKKSIVHTINADDDVPNIVEAISRILEGIK